MERDGGWIAWLRDDDLVVEQAGGKVDAGWRRGIRRDRHGMDVPEDRPRRRLDGHQIVELPVAVDVGGRDHGDPVACPRAEPAGAVGVGLSSAVDGPGVIDADGPGDADGDPSGLDDGEADSTGAGLVVASRLGSGSDDERGAGEVDGSGAGSTDGCDAGAVVGSGVGACVGSGVGACEGSGLASGDGLSSAAAAAGSWAATGAGTMMALASSSAACRRTMPLKRARRRRECCVIESSPVQRSVNVTHGGPQCTRPDRWRCPSEPLGCACVGGWQRA